MACVCEHPVEDHVGACTVDECTCAGFEPLDDGE